MSIILLNDPFKCSRPSRILDMALDPEDLFGPLISREPHHLMHYPVGYLRPWRSAASQRDSGSTVSLHKDKFQVNLDVQQFKPEEIDVKVSENTITVEGKHEEKEDEHGFISRHFVRKYVLPKDHDINKVESKLSSDGVLTIAAPKVVTAAQDARSIPVIQTGQPTKAVEKKEAEEK